MIDKKCFIHPVLGIICVINYYIIKQFSSVAVKTDKIN